MNPEQKSPEAEKETQLSQAKKTLEAYLTWSDELPEEMIIGNPKYGKHKFRGNWFQGVFSNCRFIARMKNDERFMQEIEGMRKKFSDRHHAESINVKTTREEIDEADALIKKALALVEKK